MGWTEHAARMRDIRPGNKVWLKNKTKKSTPRWEDNIHLYSPAVTVRAARFNIHRFYVLPTQCIYVFCVDLRTNSDYFPIQH
jgi:hypothetical protein